MKKLFITATLLLFAASASISQSNCINFGDYTNGYLDTVTNDNLTFPAGSTFISSGDLHLVKQSGMNFYQFINPVDNNMCYIGNLGIDVSSATYSCRTLTFDLVAGIYIAIDGDSSIVAPGANNSTANWTMTISSGSPVQVTITGQFDNVVVGYSTICIGNICLAPCLTNATNCINFGDFNNSYLNTVTNDNTAFPAGSTFISSGDLHLVKQSGMNFYQFIDSTANNMCYIGNLGIDVSSANYTCRTLTFDLVAGIYIAIDGDSSIVAQGASYNNANWSMTMSSTSPIQVTITGQFDNVVVGYSTICIGNICLSSCDSTAGVEFENQVVSELFEVYPNPVKDVLKVKVDSENYSINLFDLQGALVEQRTDLNGDTELSTASLKSGVYILAITTELGETSMKRIIKE